MSGCENYNPEEIVRGEKGLKNPADLDLTLRVIFLNPTESTAQSLALLKVG
jgi:hypothetical protein